jgi:hypothetical protein
LGDVFKRTNSFLAGIAIGGAAGALIARDRERSVSALAAALLAGGVWAAVAFWAVAFWAAGFLEKGLCAISARS